jgi:hypothetical protein
LERRIEWNKMEREKRDGNGMEMKMKISNNNKKTPHRTLDY